jgi:redox-sensitive bicupin YhaK (pirin superfamily)
MSGPATPDSEAPVAADDLPSVCDVEVLEPRRAEVGGFAVGRVLPSRARRMVGPWCFVDGIGPGLVTSAAGLDVGPHPHIGLQTVTWLVDGALLHRDSLGSEQLVRPGQLNLMTAGRGVSHSEETRGVHTGPLHGVQLWVAQPSATRDGAPAFEHHEQLSQVALDGGEAVVVIGDFAGTGSPARRDTEHVAVELRLGRGRTVAPLDPAFEHAVVPLTAGAGIAGRHVPAGHLGYLGIGRDELVTSTDEPVRVLLIGGRPFPEQLVMWWNYVARNRAEIVRAHEQWTAANDRFGRVASPLPRIDTPGPPWPSP